MFKKVLYVIVALLIGQIVLAFNIASIRADKRLELETEALYPTEEGKVRDFDYILKNINGKMIGADKKNEASYYNLEPILAAETDALNVYFFEFYSEITLNKELSEEKILYVLITDVNKTYTDVEVEEDKSSLQLTFNGEKKIDPYKINITTYELKFYELIFSMNKIDQDGYGTILKNIEIKDANEQVIFNLTDHLGEKYAEGINFANLSGKTLKEQVETNDNYRLCLSRTEHYEQLPYNHRMGKIIGSMSIYVGIVIALGLLFFWPRKRSKHSAYANYKPSNYKSNYAQNIKTKTPSQKAYQKQIEKSENVIDEPKDIKESDKSEEVKVDEVFNNEDSEE